MRVTASLRRALALAAVAIVILCSGARGFAQTTTSTTDSGSEINPLSVLQDAARLLPMRTECG